MNSKFFNRKKDRPTKMIGIGMAIGAGLGVVFGNIAIGVGAGLAIGAGLTLIQGRKDQDSKDDGQSSGGK